MAERIDVKNLSEKFISKDPKEWYGLNVTGISLICAVLLVIADLLVDIKDELQRKN